MKKNLGLLMVLFFLIGATYLLVEKSIFTTRPLLTESIYKELENLHEMRFTHAHLMLKNGKWFNAQGELVRAEWLVEFHKTIEQFKSLKTIEGNSQSAAYFPRPLTFSLNNLVFTFGDLSPAGDVFYLAIDKTPGVYLVDLSEIGSKIVADTDKILQLEKYQRFRDLISLSDREWREDRLFFLSEMGAFDEVAINQHSFDLKMLSQKPHGKMFLQMLDNLFKELKADPVKLSENQTLGKKTLEFIFKLDGVVKQTWIFGDEGRVFIKEKNSYYLLYPEMLETRDLLNNKLNDANLMDESKK